MDILNRKEPARHWQKRLGCCGLWVSAVFSATLYAFENSFNNNNTISFSSRTLFTISKLLQHVHGKEPNIFVLEAISRGHIWTHLHPSAQHSFSHFLFQWSQWSTLVNKFFLLYHRLRPCWGYMSDWQTYLVVAEVKSQEGWVFCYIQTHGTQQWHCESRDQDKRCYVIKTNIQTKININLYPYITYTLKYELPLKNRNKFGSPLPSRQNPSVSVELHEHLVLHSRMHLLMPVTGAVWMLVFLYS